MDNNISPRYEMSLVDKIETALWDLCNNKYEKVLFYIEKWQTEKPKNFHFYYLNNDVDITRTLHNMGGKMLLKIAADLGMETPGFIPSIPVFRNEIKVAYLSVSAAFESAFKKTESEPDLAVTLANSTLESLIKEILKNKNISSQIKNQKTLYDLASELLRVLCLYPDESMPKEIKTIGSSLLAAAQGIEKLRSEKTLAHGKTEDDYKIEDPLYAYFVVNCVATIGLFLNSYYKMKFSQSALEAPV